MDLFLQALSLAMTPLAIGAIGLGALVGLIFGSIPGLTFTVALALALPITFSMDPVPAMGLLLGTYIGGMTGGSVSAILLGIPGTPSAAATVLPKASRAMRLPCRRSSPLPIGRVDRSVPAATPVPVPRG